jgi:hypothetical protein
MLRIEINHQRKLIEDLQAKIRNIEGNSDDN